MLTFQLLQSNFMCTRQIHLDCIEVEMHYQDFPYWPSSILSSLSSWQSSSSSSSSSSFPSSYDFQSDLAWERWKESTGASRQIVPRVILLSDHDEDDYTNEINNNNDMTILFAGLVTEEIFYSIFSKFFPLGGDTYSGLSSLLLLTRHQFLLRWTSNIQSIQHS